METAHSVGSKYSETKNLRLTEVAKLIRADLKAAFGAGWKFSVRQPRHGNITVTVTGAPISAIRYTPEEQEMRRARGLLKAWQSEEMTAAEDKIESIMWAYNYDNSDIQADYFHRRFYDFVRWELPAPVVSLVTVRPDFGGLEAVWG